MKVTAPGGTSEVFRAEGSGDFHVHTDGNITFNSEGNDIEFLNGSPRIYLNLDVDGQVSGSSFIGDGSGLTGVTGDWDGQHTGDAAITGSLTLTSSSNTYSSLNHTGGISLDHTGHTSTTKPLLGISTNYDDLGGGMGFAEQTYISETDVQKFSLHSEAH